MEKRRFEAQRVVCRKNDSVRVEGKGTLRNQVWICLSPESNGEELFLSCYGGSAFERRYRYISSPVYILGPSYGQYCQSLGILKANFLRTGDREHVGYFYLHFRLSSVSGVV
jgi:hypothetical protein